MNPRFARNKQKPARWNNQKPKKTDFKTGNLDSKQNEETEQLQRLFYGNLPLKKHLEFYILAGKRDFYIPFQSTFGKWFCLFSFGGICEYMWLLHVDFSQGPPGPFHVWAQRIPPGAPEEGGPTPRFFTVDTRHSAIFEWMEMAIYTHFSMVKIWHHPVETTIF